jgi:hypothetical protein
MHIHPHFLLEMNPTNYDIWLPDWMEWLDANDKQKESGLTEGGKTLDCHVTANENKNDCFAIKNGSNDVYRSSRKLILPEKMIAVDWPNNEEEFTTFIN